MEFIDYIQGVIKTSEMVPVVHKWSSAELYVQYVAKNTNIYDDLEKILKTSILVTAACRQQHGQHVYHRYIRL